LAVPRFALRDDFFIVDLPVDFFDIDLPLLRFEVRFVDRFAIFLAMRLLLSCRS